MTDPTHPPEYAREQLNNILDDLVTRGNFGNFEPYCRGDMAWIIPLALRGLDMRPEWVERHGYVSLRLQRAEDLLRGVAPPCWDAQEEPGCDCPGCVIRAFLAEGEGE